MLVSESHGFAFVHVQKTGGTSLKHLLRRRVPDLQQRGGTHDPARRGRELVEGWEGLYRFAFVRNPWDRLVSWYSMLTQKRPAKARPRHPRRFRAYVLREARSFEDFVVRCTGVVRDFDGTKSIAFDQLDYLTGPDGELLVDFVGRFERLEADVARLLARIGVPDAPLPHRKATRHRHYTEYYTPALRDLVGERHRRDVAHFGYSFEEASSSNATSSASESAAASRA